MKINVNLILALLPCVLHLISAEAAASAASKPVIELVSNDVYELEATSVRLDCQATGGDDTKINWFHAESGQPVEDYHAKPATSNKMIMPTHGGRGSILILGLHRQDEGKYYCNATNTYGWTVSRNISVQIAFLRKNFVHPQSKRAKVGETVQMECRPPRGLPKPKVEWKKDEKTITDNEPRGPGRRPHYMILPNGNLRIYDAQIKDSGRYQCVAVNKAGRRESNVATLQVREKPTFIRPPSDERVNINDNVIFHCGVKGDPPPSIVWKRIDGEMPSRNEILSDNSLKLYQVQLSHSGRYVCQASNKVGRIEAVAHLLVQSPPSFTRTPMDKEVTVGDKVVFHCEVAGRPKPAVYWQFGEAPLMFTRQERQETPVTSRIHVYKDGKLVISSVRKSDEGRYVCHATSYKKHIRSTALLTVQDGDTPYPPVIKFGPMNQVLHSGRNAILRCILGRDAKAKRTEILWYKNGDALPLDFTKPRYMKASDGSLQIADVTPADSGNFTCVARGPDGLSTNQTATLRVLKKSYTADEASQVVASSDISLLPKQPIRLQVVEVQDTWVHLTWRPNPDIGTSQSQSFQVEAFCIKDNRGWVVKEAQVHQNNYRVKSLKPDTEYRFLVRARNIYGLGAPSALTNVVHTKVKSAMPDDVLHVSQLINEVRIVSVRVNSIASDAIRVRWEVRGRAQALRAVRGFDIKYKELALTRCVFNENEYKYMYCSLQGHRRRLLEDSLRSGDRAVFLAGQKDTKMYSKRYNEEVSIDSRAVTYIIYGLKPFRCYSVEIEPYTLGEFIGKITGKDSKKKVTLTFDSVPAKAPDRISARWFVNNSVEISWRPPPVDSRNGVLDGYSIHIVGNETRFNKYRTTNSSQHSIVVNDMVPEVAYTIHLAARTCKGEGVRSIALRLGPAAQRASGGSVITQAWFIATMIGVGFVWVLLCLFTVFVCRHRYHRNLLYKPVYFNGSLEERTQMNACGGTGYNMRSLVGKHDPDSVPSVPPPPPPPLSVVASEKAMSASTETTVQMRNGAYATPSSVLPPIAPVQNPVAPYATASIIQNMISLQPPSAGAYCAASSDNSAAESKDPSGGGCVAVGANSSSYGGHYSEGGPPGTCSEYSESQGEEPIGATGWPPSLVGGRQKIKNIGEIIPPPPEYPPPPAPSSGSSAPMSPKPGLSLAMGTSMMSNSAGQCFKGVRNDYFV